MPTGSRSTSRPGAGPGRGKSRPRPQARKAPHAEPDDQDARDEASQEAVSARRSVGRRVSVTGRAIALAVVLLILTISYASSLRIYFAQAQDIASTKAEISQRQLVIADLQTDLGRWDDPAYVKTQARARLGWVVPGETGYEVVGADGKPLGGGVEIGTEGQPAQAPKPAWWTKLWGSVEAADRPAPAVKPSAKKAKPPTVSVSTKPTPGAKASSTPR
jgi:cell division protein FtsB